MIGKTLVLGLLLAVPAAVSGQTPLTDLKVTRAVASLNGVFSPRGFFNITVRLYQLAGVQSAKFDLKKSRITLDFQPGVTVSSRDIRQVMVAAGYKPGPVDIQLLSPPGRYRNRPRLGKDQTSAIEKWLRPMGSIELLGEICVLKFYFSRLRLA